MITSEQLEATLWAGADDLRGSMDASRYKDYMLGLMFYKFLSEKTLLAVKEILGTKAVTEELIAEYEEAYAENGSDLTDMLMQAPGYYILPQNLYDKWVQNINHGTFELQKVIDGLNDFERMIAGAQNKDDFEGLFSTMDLTDNALGANLKTRSENISSLIKLFSDLSIVELQENDVIGDAYEYLIGKFAMESGKKAGEFYTPHQVSDVMARIIVQTTNELKSIYDPTVGSGSLLLTIKHYLEEDKRENLHYYGQEKNTATFNLTRMNLLLHGVKPDMMDINNADTLAEDWPEDPARPNEGRLFDAVAMNPPYSLKKWNKSKLTASDPRFQQGGALPPDNKGDFAFLLHGLYHLNEHGTMAIVLPHGVLFRGAAEGIIRKNLIEKNKIDAVIGMPANLFTNTSIPVIIMVLRKDRELGAPILMIDASKGFVKEGKTNQLRERDIARIVDTVVGRKEIEGFSHLASLQEIKENGYNLNIPRYVTPIDEDIPHDADAHIMGGIPEKNIKDLAVLQTVMPDVINGHFVSVRSGYVKVKGEVKDIEKSVYDDERLISVAAKLRQEVDEYIAKYWEAFRTLNAQVHPNLIAINSTMLQEIKSILGKYQFMDVYSGYQIIADLWKSSLTQDLKFICGEGFYEAARMLEPNMVTKGSGDKKREEQDGWKGHIIPNELVADVLMQDEQAEIAEQENKVLELKASLDEWTEKAGVEESEEGEYLGDCLKEDKSAFDSKQVNSALKEAEKGTDEYKMISEIKTLMADIKAEEKTLKTMKLELIGKIEARYPNLTEQEIDTLLFTKWFDRITDRIVELVKEPYARELKLIAELKDRYISTIDEIDAEIAELEKVFAAMQSELVVME